MTSGEGTEEERGGEGSALLCLSSPPNATHVRGLGNNESPSQWDRRHYRAHAASLCERQFCCRLSFSCQPLPCDAVTFRSFPPLCCVWDSITLGLMRSHWTVARVPQPEKTHKHIDLYHHWVRSTGARTSSLGMQTEIGESVCVCL